MESLKQVYETAQRMLRTDELAEHWLTHPALALDGRRPLDLLATATGIQAVEDLLTCMEFGVYLAFSGIFQKTIRSIHGPKGMHGKQRNPAFKQWLAPEMVP